MGMAGDHLGRDGFDDIGEAEMTGLVGHPGMVDGLEEQVAKFALQLAPGLPVDGIGHLMRFLKRVGGDGGEGLPDVPGAAGPGVAQGGHDGEKPVDAGRGQVGVSVMVRRGKGHCGHRCFAI